MQRVSITLAGALLSLCLTHHAAADDFDRLAVAVAATENQSASFTHTFRPHGSDHEVKELGTVTFGTLPQMRWVYQSPEEKTFVFDGVTSWLYVPADRQVSAHRLSESERSQLPFLLLKDEEEARRRFRISSSTSRLELTPKGDGPIQTLVVSTDPRSNRIRSIEYDDNEGNHTRFSFEHFQKISPDRKMFRFEAPPDVEVVEY